jgi:hypothetical protein
VLKMLVVVRPVQVIPSGLVAIEFVELPVATQRLKEELHVIPVPVPVIPELPRPVQVIPSELVAKTLVPEPTATKMLPFQATPYTVVVIGLVLCTQLIPSTLV